MLNGEKNLIKRAIRGEASAFGLLYDYYQPQIYRFIYLKVSHREEAEDLTHQVFLKSWLKINEFRYEGFPFSSWLYRIARNEVIDYYRTKKIHLDIEYVNGNEDALLGDLLGENGNVAPDLDQELDLETVRNAILKLKPIEQDILILRFIEDMQPAEIARSVERKPEAVRLIQHRAIKNLKKILEGGAKNAKARE